MGDALAIVLEAPFDSSRILIKVEWQRVNDNSPMSTAQVSCNSLLSRGVLRIVGAVL